MTLCAYRITVTGVCRLYCFKDFGNKWAVCEELSDVLSFALVLSVMVIYIVS